MNNIELNVKGLKCDAEDCDYIDMDINTEDYEQYIDAPCPKCGAPLLTQADYDLVRVIEQAALAINKIDFGDMFNEQHVQVGLEMNGTGTLQVKEL